MIKHDQAKYLRRLLAGRRPSPAIADAAMIFLQAEIPLADAERYMDTYAQKLAIAKAKTLVVSGDENAKHTPSSNN